MSSAKHLHFQSGIGRQKPESIVNRSTKCPFCERDSLEDIMAEDGPILLVKNKFPVLEDTLMTVLIETDTCDSDLSQYSKDHLYRLIRFGVDQWLKLEASGEYQSVIFYKNHGPLSGGSIHHPHMQIVGMKNLDYRETLKEEYFEGLLIDQRNGVTFNISTKPRVGFNEFNVLLPDLAQLDTAADYIQDAVQYIFNSFKASSYNLFFYQFQGEIRIKIVPRWVTSPLFVGYGLQQVSDRIYTVAEEMRTQYTSKMHSEEA